MWYRALYRYGKCVAAPLAALAFAHPATAGALPAVGLLPMVAPIAAKVEIGTGCKATGGETLLAPHPPAVTVSYSKSSAILGGEMSALERMKAQQSGQLVEPATLGSVATSPKLEPAAAGVRLSVKPCIGTYSGVDRVMSASPVAPTNPDDFLASKRVQIAKTSFDRDWKRVRYERLSASQRPQIVQPDATSFETVEGINKWVNKNIRYVEDRELFGRADYWAGARRTMKLRKGDCEDIALVKMQLLAAAGFSRDDMYITIARDTIRRADHALLVVKLGERFVVLDNATDTVLDGSASHGYAPVLSFAADKSWLHGY